MTSTRAEDLRRAFDRAFSEPPAAVEEREPLLALRAARAPLALRLTEIAGLFAKRTVVRLPSHVREFVGMVVLRREVVPVYSLQALLGLPTTDEAPRWLVLARGSRVAFAFEEFEAHLQVPASAILLTEGEGVRHASAVVQHGAGKRSVVSVPALIATIEQRLGGGPP